MAFSEYHCFSYICIVSTVYFHQVLCLKHYYSIVFLAELLRRQEELRRMEEIHTQEMQKRKEMQLRYMNLFDFIHIFFNALSLNLYMNIKQKTLLLQHAHTCIHMQMADLVS